MNPREVIRVALRALARNKLRTILTMLGIIIGVGAVICTVAIGQGASAQVQQQIQSLGDNIVMVFAGSVNTGGVRMGNGATKTLVNDDADAILQHVPNVTMISPIVGSSVQVVNGNQNWLTRANGTSADITQIRHWPVVQGSMFSDRDVNMAANVCVLGNTVAQQLFGDQDPVGQMIRVQNLPFRVLGVLLAKGQNSNGQDQDDMMIVPYTTVQKKISGISWLQMIMVATTSQQDMSQVQTGIAALLRQRHHLRPTEDDDFIIRSPNEMAQAAEATSLVMTFLLAGIASISLLVGGIGIMNIMLVSVTERTREIGVRMAVGATEEDVQAQFLSEALVLSSMGGLAGIALGMVASAIISNVLHWTTVVSLLSVVVAVVFSAGVGIVFGYYPARRAAALDPIEALRYE
ncbi:MAG TPA: ABC transporter permease [Candidatus Baltobacteraceae bacterium]|jgi:putative ABC transport system permease protein|nr:ABC transporter permease [Candidatus Baltobacteraceae bacterium]